MRISREKLYHHWGYQPSYTIALEQKLMVLVDASHATQDFPTLYEWRFLKISANWRGLEVYILEFFQKPHRNSPTNNLAGQEIAL